MVVLRGPARPDLLREECLADILRTTARRRPEHPALMWGDRIVSYRQLDAASDRLAAGLACRGAGPGRIAGLLLPRGADLLIAQAGICKSGAAWLPFDADTPVERVDTCLRSAGACGLLTCRAWLPRLCGVSVPVWAFEDLLTADSSGTARPPMGASPADPAYVIYTSGSTGQPKGIVVTHRSICHFLRSENEILGVREDDRVYQGFSAAFDMSFEEIWIAYLAGATLWIAPAETVTDPERVARALSAQRITVLHAVPTLLGLLEGLPPGVRLVNMGGEACPEALVGRLACEGRELFNTYGPTEATVSASLAVLQPGQPVTIGKPLPNYGLLVVDEQRRPLPTGEAGELGIFGPGVAVGYLGRPELTADRFVANPAAAAPDEERLYLTGDLARIGPSGAVEYLGRADGQVKIRGFRVELGEIEAVLAAQPGVAAAAVVMRPAGGLEQLVGFVVAGLNQSADPAELRRALSARLPPYMVPAHLELVSQLPRLTSGKVDRKALRGVPLRTVEIDAAGRHAEPRNEDEAALFAAIGKLFPGRGLWPEADFFDDLGGHSLLAARLVSALRAQAQYAALGVGDVYRQRSLAAIAATMGEHRQRTQPAAAPPRVAVPWQRRVLCGLAQALVIPFLVVLHIADWLAPFFTYHCFTGDEGDSVLWAVLYSVAAFVAADVATFGVAIAGKWLIVGRVKAGRFPLWGVVYYRWWLADALCSLPPLYLLSGTPLLNGYLRAMGARIGRDVLIDSVSVQSPDLLRIDSGASVGTSVHVGNARVEGGELVLGPVHIGRDAVVDSYAALENNTVLGAGSRLSGLSALAAGRRVPAGETWEGAPARRVERAAEPLPPRPAVSRAGQAGRLAFFAVAGMAVATMFFMTVFPSFMLIDWIDGELWDLYESEAHPLLAFGLFFLLGIPASMVLVLGTVLLAGGFRRLFLPRQRPGKWPIASAAYCRKWLLTRVLDASLGVLHGLYASVFAPAWLRLMGARVGRGAEVSTAAGIVPDLVSLGEHSFIADGVMLGDEEQRDGWMVLRSTAIGARSFVGNGAYVGDGAAVPNDVLIGVQTRTPDNLQMQSGQTWLGSPPLLLPARECLAGFDDSLTFRPSWQRRLARGVVEALRIVLPLAFVIASGYLIVQLAMPLVEEEEWVELTAALTVAGCLYGLASYVLVLGLKWILMGRYRPRAAPMWTRFVWFSEAVTNLYESLAVPNLLAFLSGTPMLPWALRLLGAHVGKGVFLDTTDLTEFDCVTIGDEAELNAGCGPQTHLFEDRVMKIGTVEIGARVTVGSCSTILYDTQIGDDVRLGPLTLVAKGERLPPRTCWEGSPAAPARD